MGVAGDQHHRVRTAYRVQLGSADRTLPRTSPMPETHQQTGRLAATGHLLGHHLANLFRAAGGARVKAQPHHRPLPEVDVVVPETRRQPATVSLNGLLGAA